MGHCDFTASPKNHVKLLKKRDSGKHIQKNCNHHAQHFLRKRADRPKTQVLQEQPLL